MASAQDIFYCMPNTSSDFEYYHQTYQCFSRKTNRLKVLKEWIENKFDSTVVQKLSNTGETLDVLGIGSGEGE